MWLGVTSVGAFLHPDPHHHGTHMELGLPPCPCALLFHRPCPGCGLTTSFTATIHGDLAAAFTAHPLGPFLYLIFSVTALISGYGWWKGKRVRSEQRVYSLGLSCTLAGFLLFGVYRFATTVYPVAWWPSGPEFAGLSHNVTTSGHMTGPGTMRPN